MAYCWFCWKPMPVCLRSLEPVPSTQRQVCLTTNHPVLRYLEVSEIFRKCTYLENFRIFWKRFVAFWGISPFFSQLSWNSKQPHCLVSYREVLGRVRTFAEKFKKTSIASAVAKKKAFSSRAYCFKSKRIFWFYNTLRHNSSARSWRTPCLFFVRESPPYSTVTSRNEIRQL